MFQRLTRSYTNAPGLTLLGLAGAICLGAMVTFSGLGLVVNAVIDRSEVPAMVERACRQTPGCTGYQGGFVYEKADSRFLFRIDLNGTFLDRGTAEVSVTKHIEKSVKALPLFIRIWVQEPKVVAGSLDRAVDRHLRRGK